MMKQTAALLLTLLLSPFMLTAREGYVSLYCAEADSWVMTDTPLSSLPEADQALLQEGLPLDTPQQVTTALEDFCS